MVGKQLIFIGDFFFFLLLLLLLLSSSNSTGRQFFSCVDKKIIRISFIQTKVHSTSFDGDFVW